MQTIFGQAAMPETILILIITIAQMTRCCSFLTALSQTLWTLATHIAIGGCILVSMLYFSHIMRLLKSHYMGRTEPICHVSRCLGLVGDSNPEIAPNSSRAVHFCTFAVHACAILQTVRHRGLKVLHLLGICIGFAAETDEHSSDGCRFDSRIHLLHVSDLAQIYACLLQV